MFETNFCPQIVSISPIWARLGPFSVPQSETENWPYLGLDGLNRHSKAPFSPCQLPLLVVSTTQNGPHAPGVGKVGEGPSYKPQAEE